MIAFRADRPRIVYLELYGFDLKIQSKTAFPLDTSHENRTFLPLIKLSLCQSSEEWLQAARMHY